MDQYKKIQNNLAIGWNTWDTRNVLTHVLLPSGASVNLGLIASNLKRKDKFLIGMTDARIHSGSHSYNGYYTDISLTWKTHHVRIRSAAEGDKNVILVTPYKDNKAGGKVVVALKGAWNLVNSVSVFGNKFSITANKTQSTVEGRVLGEVVSMEKKIVSNEIHASADKAVVIVCNVDYTLQEALVFVENHEKSFVSGNRERYKEDYNAYNAMQSVLAWNTIYDPSIRKVITPVSRGWNVSPMWRHPNPALGGFVLFCWDTYFAAAMLSMEAKELAYANAVEITYSATERGFVPNFYAAGGHKAHDRSQPPVGAFVCWMIYQKHRELWFLQHVYKKLLIWNRWWNTHRNIGGLLCWGSDPYPRKNVRKRRGSKKVIANNRDAAVLESGLDNSPMYRDLVFDPKLHMLRLNDVGLTSLYITDCTHLAFIADALGRAADAGELRSRADMYIRNMAMLWDEDKGLYYNRHTDIGTLSPRISPTHFYPFLAGLPAFSRRVDRMVTNHLLNPAVFWGEWVLPSASRSDPAFGNSYWRGRVWGPMNFLVYMGLRNCNTTAAKTARRALAEKSVRLLTKSWLAHGYVFENYNSVNGMGDDVVRSDRFYHWGGLLGFIGLIEDGYYFSS